MYLNNFDIINKRLFKHKPFAKKCLYTRDYKKRHLQICKRFVRNFCLLTKKYNNEFQQKKVNLQFSDGTRMRDDKSLTAPNKPLPGQAKDPVRAKCLGKHDSVFGNDRTQCLKGHADMSRFWPNSIFLCL